ncbi:ATP-binding protein [Streptomyces sp. YS415]|uniref:sensor histidine kinase n=1 Tax=Streptomyces sp. YS415 TaxID=2944806 RepID=UPI002020DD01|nr:ATP-binding protein [Streptomyces sp. YS415]MCL7430328.1 ATP-binding protein [Streptomyces sp. YS415]
MSRPRLLVRHKLHLLVLVPLAALLLLSVPMAGQRLTVVEQSDRTAEVMRRAGAVSQVLEQLQREQLLAVAHLAARSASTGHFLAQTGAVDAQLDDARSQGPHPAEVDAALDAVAGLSGLRAEVMARSVDAGEAARRYDESAGALLDSLRLWSHREGSAADMNRQSALDALLRSDAAGNSADTALLASLATGEGTAGARSDAAAQQNLQAVWAARFQRIAGPEHIRLSRILSSGSVAVRARAFADRIRAGTREGRLPEAERARLLEGAANAFRLQAELRLLVQHTIARDTEAVATANARSAVTAATLLGGLLLLVLVSVVLLSHRVGRSIAVPLRLLTEATGRAADTAERELLRIADDDAAEPLDDLPSVTLNRSDEIGALSTTVDRVQNGAYELVRRQQAGQQNVAAMFAGVGRRTLNLVSRQLAMIDDLERDGTDKDLLERLYALDHLTTRLRRSAANLVVLSGEREDYDLDQPVSVLHAVRSALGEVEDFHRVRLHALTDVMLAPGTATPLMSIVAELLENALSFSPPHTSVEVSVTRVSAGCLVTVKDRGVGMTPGLLAESNARIRSRERLDLVPTDTLGLFVVGRLARRTGIAVHLEAGVEGGLVAWVTVPHTQFVRGARLGTPDTAPRAVTSGVPASPPVPSGAAVSLPPVPAPMPMPMPMQDLVPLPPSSPSSPPLTGRVPQAHGGGPAVARPAAGPSDPWNSGPDPEAIRRLAEQFEAGVRRARTRRAEEAAGTTSGPAGPPAPAAGGADGPPRTGPLEHFLDDLRREIAQLQRFQPWSAFGDEPSDGAVSPTTPPAKTTPALVRRVPGASLAVSPAAPAASSVARTPGASAEAVRSLLESFESGVARARTEASARPHPPAAFEPVQTVQTVRETP